MLAWTQWLSCSRNYPQDDTGRHTQTHTQVRVWTHTVSSHIIYKTKNISFLVEGRNVLLQLRDSQKWVLMYVILSQIFSFSLTFSGSPAHPSFFPFLLLTCLFVSPSPLFLCHAVKTGRMWQTRRLLTVPGHHERVCVHLCVCVFLFIHVCMCQQDRWTQLSA